MKIQYKILVISLLLMLVIALLPSVIGVGPAEPPPWGRDGVHPPPQPRGIRGGVPIPPASGRGGTPLQPPGGRDSDPVIPIPS